MSDSLLAQAPAEEGQQPDPAANPEGEAAVEKPVEQTAEGQAAPAEGEAKADGEAKPEEAKPVEYADFKLPEGVPVDEQALTVLKEWGAKYTVPQEGVQEIIDQYADKMKAVAEAPYNEWAETQQTWISQVKADPVYGGKNLDQTMRYCGMALERFGDAELREAMTFTGAGNHPAIIRAFAKIGKAASEDGFVAGKGAGTRPAGDAYERLAASYQTPNS